MPGMGREKRGQEMQRKNESEWFCANCLQMIEMLSRHGRCPHCDSNAVDVAYRWRRSEAEVRPEVVLSINA
jgi:Zn finger protein HypA/HybF involved in hydrogenase expression